MNFDAKSLLIQPSTPAAPAMTVDALAARLAEIVALGMGGALVTLPDGQAINAVQLEAHGEVPAHFVLGRRPVP